MITKPTFVENDMVGADDAIAILFSSFDFVFLSYCVCVCVRVYTEMEKNVANEQFSGGQLFPFRFFLLVLFSFHYASITINFDFYVCPPLNLISHIRSF